MENEEASPEEKETRKNSRFPVDIAAEIILDGSEQSDYQTILNLSLGGALLTASTRHKLGKAVTIRFSVPGAEKPIEIGALVRWATDDTSGVQFQGLRAKEVWELTEFFKRL